MKSYSVNIESTEHSFSVKEGESILSAGRRNGVCLPFECGWGSCASCKVTLVSGEVSSLFSEAPAITPRDSRRNRILTCQSTPVSNVVIKTKVLDNPPDELCTETYEAVLIKKTELGPDICQFQFQLDRKTEFLAGQYAIVNLDEKLRRCYSMSNLSGSDIVEFVLKKYEGVGSTSLHAMAEGTKIDIDLPYGATWLRDTEMPLAFIAGGTGVAPILSQLREIAKSRRMADQPIFVFFGAQTSSELVCLNELQELIDSLTNASFVPVVTDAEDDWKGDTGLVTEVVKNYLHDMSAYTFYVAGPPPMVNATLELLEENKVSFAQIYHDSFG